MNPDLKSQALQYHAQPTPGKIGISITKPCDNQMDLSLAYTPGVAEPVREIAADPEKAYLYTSKGNLVAVITDGSAILGLGNCGALAAKPVMEGKAVLFKKFAAIDVFDIEVDCRDPDDFINTVVNISPTFGGINLEDIAAPHCFYVEQELSRRLQIPVFHDDQHGTAIIISAALLNALRLQQKQLSQVKVVCLGAGAAGIASMRLLCALGADKNNIRLLDRQGVVHIDREDLNEYKREFATIGTERSLADALIDADVFIGVSGGGLLSPELLKLMAPKPIVFALANPDPEIWPDVAKKSRKDMIIATGRSDFPNQVNNVLGFPFIFRGALDVHARSINREMHIAAVNALMQLTQEPVPQSVLTAYQLPHLEFSREYIIPKPFDPRLIDTVSTAVAQAAIRTGVARKK